MTGTVAVWIPVVVTVGLGVALVAQLLVLGEPRRWARQAGTPVARAGRETRRRGAATAAATRRTGAAAASATRRRGEAVGGTAARWARRRPTPGQSFIAAVVVGAVLRLLWVIWATRTPTGLRDPAEYLRIAGAFSHGETLRFGGGGDPSAFWPPGYPAMLTPFVWLARQTGWAGTAFVASLVNVAAGTVTVALSGVLAGRWIGERSRTVAAWLVALCPALIYWTSTPHTETAFTPVFLGVLVLASAAAAAPSRRRWAVVGALVALAFLVRSPGMIGLAAPALAIRAASGSWRGALRATAVVAVVATALLVPWTIRNGVQVGLWTPASTNNAGAVCFGHHDEAPTLWEPEKLSAEFQLDCYQGSPYDDRRFEESIRAGAPGTDTSRLSPDPDEAAWYRSAMGRGIRWAVTHPAQEVPLSIGKLWETWSSEGRVVDGARNYEDPGWGGRWHGPLEALADLWGWVVGALALLSLVAVPACRRALPIWVPIVLYSVMIVGGVIDPHYRYPVVPLVAVLAAGLVTRPGRRAGPGGDPPGATTLGDNDTGEPVPSIEEMSV